MSSTPIGMGEQDQAEREKFVDELKRILAASEKESLSLRVIGSLAFQLHCPTHGYLQAAMGRAYTDIDFAAYKRHSREIRGLMNALGYEEDREVFTISEGDRAIFNHPTNGLHVDVFYDKLDFCHTISWSGRLEADAPTIPLAEMLLEKMQIVKINAKDVIDTIMLLLEHPLGETDRERINVGRIAQLCARDWGLWRTLTMNLEKVSQLAQEYPQLSPDQKSQVFDQTSAIRARLDAEPKSTAWKLRARVGERVKWYQDVDEVK